MKPECPELVWVGPFAVSEYPPHDNYHIFAGKKKGVYCWCVPVNGQYWVTYIGKADGVKGFAGRLPCEIKNSQKGRYEQLLDFQEYKAGRRLVIRERLRQDSTAYCRDRHEPFLDHYRMMVDATVIFLAEVKRPWDDKIHGIEHSTIRQVHIDLEDVEGIPRPPNYKTDLQKRLEELEGPGPAPKYAPLLVNGKYKNATDYQVSHRSDHQIRGLTSGK